ncbi:hypothetical protein OBB02_00250 [Candidatus Puniceispirillum sp.]|nr:hypothetical protein [Candidatus Puniceispirillum sp.]
MGKKYFARYLSHWFILIMVAYSILSAIQALIILPIETLLISHNTAIVSIVYLPHSVRVLSVWMVGPRAIFALVPASLIVQFIMKIGDGMLSPSDAIVALVGALCAPVAFELMRGLRINIYPSRSGVVSWRTLVFAGFLSSILNSFFSTFFLEDKFPVQDTFNVLTRFIIGDVMGLVVVLFLFLGLLKAFRRFSDV